MGSEVGRALAKYGGTMSRSKHKIPAAQGETVKGFPASYHCQHTLYVLPLTQVSKPWTLSIGMKRKLGNALAMLQKWWLQLWPLHGFSILVKRVMQKLFAKAFLFTKTYSKNGVKLGTSSAFTSASEDEKVRWRSKVMMVLVMPFMPTNQPEQLLLLSFLLSGILSQQSNLTASMIGSSSI